MSEKNRVRDNVVQALLMVALLLGFAGFGVHIGINMGHRDLRCGFGTVAVQREAATGMECLPLEPR